MLLRGITRPKRCGVDKRGGAFGEFFVTYSNDGTDGAYCCGEHLTKVVRIIAGEHGGRSIHVQWAGPHR